MTSERTQTQPTAVPESRQGDERIVQPVARLDPQLVKELSQLRPWITVAHIAREWLFILAPIILCIQYWSLWLYVAVVIWIGARQHALGILMHEGTHYRITKNRLLNELIGHVFLAFPTLGSMSGFARPTSLIIARRTRKTIRTGRIVTARNGDFRSPAWPCTGC